MKSYGLLFTLGATALAACQASVNVNVTAGPTCDLEPSVSASDCTALHSMALPTALPPAPGNAKADDEGAAALGFLVFYDGRFSSNGKVRCGTCHLPEVRFNDAKPVSTGGLVPITRNSPTVLNASRMTTVFWDGRADSLWSQPLFAFENPKEMGFSRLGIAHQIDAFYKDRYVAVFGDLPSLAETKRFPLEGKPGDPAWDNMSPNDKDAINRVAANVGKALEAYERKVSGGQAAFDRYLAGDATALTDVQKRGLAAFTRAGCLDCHSGPMFSDMKFHNLGIPADPGEDVDRGRADGIPILEGNPFNLAGTFADPPSTPVSVAAPTEADVGAFRTATLRNVTFSRPYGHNGHFSELTDVIAFHVRGGGRGGSGFVGEVDSKIVLRSDITDADVADIAEFLVTLEGDYPGHPWNDWPQK